MTAKTLHPVVLAAMLCALDLFLSKPKDVVIVGERGHPATESLLAAVHQQYVPNKTLLVIDEARAGNHDLDRPRLLTVMLGAVCHDLGKPATTAFIDGRIRSPDHEQAGVAPTLQLLDRLNVQTPAAQHQPCHCQQQSQQQFQTAD